MAQQHVHGSPQRLVQGSPRLVQGSPSFVHQGSPGRSMGLNQSLGQYTTTNQTFVQQQNFVQQPHIHAGQQNFVGTGETIIERIVEAPVVVTHHEAGVVRSLYEGQEVFRTEETRSEQHTMAPIVKEIHQDVIHEHHKDVLIEHKKDIIHEHHQNIIHQHNQPIIYEKHIHEHHQPIIHEKHTTLIEEKHIPIIQEQHSHSTNVQERQEIVTEVFEQPVVKEVYVNPVVREVQAEAVILQEGVQNFQGVQQQQHIHANQGLVGTGGVHQTTHTVETVTTGGNVGGYGVGNTYGNTYYQEGAVYENEVDEFGRPKKAGFFSNLKSKLGSHKKEQKII